jgi:hypothetical protein
MWNLDSPVGIVSLQELLQTAAPIGGRVPALLLRTYYTRMDKTINYRVSDLVNLANFNLDRHK